MFVVPSPKTEFRVTVDGVEITGLLRASIISTNGFSADTYALTFAMAADPLTDIAFWSSINSAYVEVMAISSSGAEPVSLITGMIDTIQADPIQGTVGIEGRDLSSLLIDTYRQQDFVNQTASEIATSVAMHHNLQPVVTATSGNIGRYYGDGYTKISLGQFSRFQSDWDLLVQLARQTDSDLFVADRFLYFQPIDISSYPLTVSVLDVQRLRIARNLHVSEGNSAQVQSWNSQTMAAYKSTDRLGGTEPDQVAGITVPPFLFSASNYTAQQVTEAAAQYNKELARLTTTLQIDTPWDLTLSPRTLISLDGTESAFDATYRIETIERHYSCTSGSLQTIRASLIQGD